MDAAARASSTRLVLWMTGSSETAREASPATHPRRTEPEHQTSRVTALDAVIGVGGSAVVWSGVDATGRAVAVKVPHRGRDEVDERQALVEQQVLHGGAARAPRAAAVGRALCRTGARRSSSTSSAVPCCVAWCGSRGHLRPGEVVTVLTPICEAVAHLHAAGGVHADISPSNITLTRIGSPVLLDLGAARVAGREPGAVHGTPGLRRT